MKELKRGGNVFRVDIEQTKAYYQNNTVCECEDCQYLHANIRGRFPELEAFLAEFGLDITNFDEAGLPVELDGKYLYTFVGYTVCGAIRNLAEPDMELPNTDGLRIGVDRGFAFPNDQKGDYFSLSVLDVSLPCERAREHKPESWADSLRLKMKRVFGKHT